MAEWGVDVHCSGTCVKNTALMSTAVHLKLVVQNPTTQRSLYLNYGPSRKANVLLVLEVEEIATGDAQRVPVVDDGETEKGRELCCPTHQAMDLHRGDADMGPSRLRWLSRYGLGRMGKFFVYSAAQLRV